MKITESRRDGCVGLWWFTNNKQLIGTIATLEEAELDGIYYQYSRTENHATKFREVVKQQVDDAEEQAEILSGGFRSIERGRVLYDTRTGSYTVTCSDNLVNNREFRNKVKDFYNLNSDMVDFEVLRHYVVRKPTGNPFVDNFDLET